MENTYQAVHFSIFLDIHLCVIVRGLTTSPLQLISFICFFKFKSHLILVLWIRSAPPLVITLSVHISLNNLIYSLLIPIKNKFMYDPCIVANLIHFHLNALCDMHCTYILDNI